MVQVLCQRETVVLRRKVTAQQRDRVDVSADPVGRAQHLVDRKPWDLGSPPLVPNEALLLNRGNKLVVFERCGGRVVNARMDGEDPHAAAMIRFEAGRPGYGVRATASGSLPTARPSSGLRRVGSSGTARPRAGSPPRTAA